jgi:hypothetical protein
VKEGLLMHCKERSFRCAWQRHRQRGLLLGVLLVASDLYHSRMKTFDRKAKMDEMEPLEHEGWQVLCSGEQGAFQATVRYKAPPDGQIRTLVLDAESHGTAEEALAHAKELARKWARERNGGGRGDG